MGIVLFLYHLLWRDKEAEKFAVAYAKKKQKLEDEQEKQRQWKQHILTALDTYIDSLTDIGKVAIFPSGEVVKEYGWPDVHHRLQTAEFLSKFDFYQNWKRQVADWESYREASTKERMTYKTKGDVDVEFRQKVTNELSKSGIPSGKREVGGVINPRYADYDELATLVMASWQGATPSYDVLTLQRKGYADSPDGSELDSLVNIIGSLISGTLKNDHKEAIDQVQVKTEAWNKLREQKWRSLLDKREEVLSRLKTLRDDIEAERVPINLSGS